ncbi:MAG: acetyltransferase [Bacteroidota bacterium]
MLIVGAKGFSKEVLEVLYQNDLHDDVVFYDDISNDLSEKLYGRFKVLTNMDDAKLYFEKVNQQFTIGIGNPLLRYKLSAKFIQAGGVFTSTISPKASVGHFGNQISEGCNIMTGAIITSDVTIGMGCLINLNCTIGHDTIIGDFTELSPGVNISGNCRIGKFSNLGTNAIVLPKITIGDNVVVAAGAVVTKDVPDNSMVAGVPAVLKKNLDPITI